MIGIHTRSSAQVDGEGKALSQVREYPRRRHLSDPFSHQIGIKRGSGDIGRAFSRSIGLVRACKLLGKKANDECRLIFSMASKAAPRPSAWR